MIEQESSLLQLVSSKNSTLSNDTYRERSLFELVSFFFIDL